MQELRFVDRRLGFRRALPVHLNVLAVWFGILFAVPVEGAPQTADARLFCRSVRVQAGSTSFGSTLEFSTIGFAPAANGELAPLDVSGLPSHVTGFKLDGLGSPEPIFGELVVDLPFTDVNDNGFGDFFEVAEGIQASTDGQYNVAGFDQGTIEATWSRPAGVAEGTCTFHLVSSGFGSLGDFSHRFAIIEYAGQFHYVAGTNTVSADLDARGSSDESLRLAGPVELTRSQLPNRFDELGLSGGTWTNQIGATLQFGETMLYRDPPYPTNYYAFIAFEDGDLATSAEDYWSWMLSVDDPNDTDADGIPDLSDDPSVNGAPVLRLRIVAQGLELAISGVVGGLYEIESRESLNDEEWQLVQTLTLTNSTQLVALPVPESGVAFWRVLAR